MTENKYAMASDEQLASEAQLWAGGGLRPDEWIDAPDAIPRHDASTPVSIRVPTRMLTVLKAFAERDGVGYQALMKRWLDDRINEEWEKLSAQPGADRDHLAVASKTTEPGDIQSQHQP